MQQAHSDMDNLYYNRIEALRAVMAQRGWDAVILTGSDPHASEYPAPRWKQVEWLSGFTGEAGDLVVTADHAGLWTDTRYFIQALQQLRDTGIELHKMRVPEQVPIPEWLADHFARKDAVIVAVDGLCQQVASIQALQSAFDATGRSDDPDEGYYYRIIDIPDLLDGLWTDRPAIPRTPITTVPLSVAGESRRQRIDWLRQTLAGNLCDAALITSLDEIAWLLNVRGSDIDFNPMVISYLLVSEEEVRWFVRKDAFDDRDDDTTLDSFAELEEEGIRVLPYDEVQLSLSDLLDDGRINRLFVDPSTLNWSLYNLLSQSGRLWEGPSPVQLRKAVKNPVEIEGMRRAHRQDGVAMELFLYWLERMIDTDKVITERTAATKLGALRAACPDYLGDSFETISAYGPGAALPH
jgi:Xaa-Pro aminopeptidase